MIMDDETTIDDRNNDLFFTLADIVDFDKESYCQNSWGHYRPTEQQKELMAVLFPQTDRIPSDDVRWAHVGCDTHACIAGHAARLSGYHPSYTLNEKGVHVSNWTFVCEQPGHPRRHGQRIQHVSAKLLGISLDEAHYLFYSDNEWTADDLRSFGKGETIVDHPLSVKQRAEGEGQHDE
tara:strand:+ start:662 stop:1198 length:537 start_codon:yes stop_codon:yes gene_type:complete